VAALFPEVSQAGLDIDAGHFLHDPLGVLVVVLAPHKPAYRAGNGFNSHAYKRPISPLVRLNLEGLARNHPDR
jgi:hypothetical protein